MARHTITASARIAAPAERIYGIIADYREQHPKILPRPPFVMLEVEEGGYGAGTVIRFQMKVMGRVQTARATITEPEPGRVLVETIQATDTVTSFIVDPRDGGRAADVTITTETTIRDGLFGRFEGWMTTRMLHPTYVRELAQLAEVATQA